MPDDYELGRRGALLKVIQDCFNALRVDDPARGQAAWVLERQELILHLRRLCAIYGDNDWTEDDHLGDVLDRHLGYWLDHKPRT